MTSDTLDHGGRYGNHGIRYGRNGTPKLADAARAPLGHVVSGASPLDVAIQARIQRADAWLKGDGEYLLQMPLETVPNDKVREAAQALFDRVQGILQDQYGIKQSRYANVLVDVENAKDRHVAITISANDYEQKIAPQLAVKTSVSR